MTHPAVSAVSAASTPHLATPLPVPPVPPPPSGCSAASPLASSGCVADHRLWRTTVDATDALRLVIDYAKRRPTASREALKDAARKITGIDGCGRDLAWITDDHPYIRAALPHIKAVLREARDLYEQHHPFDYGCS